MSPIQIIEILPEGHALVLFSDGSMRLVVEETIKAWKRLGMTVDAGRTFTAEDVRLYDLIVQEFPHYDGLDMHMDSYEGETTPIEVPRETIETIPRVTSPEGTLANVDTSYDWQTYGIDPSKDSSVTALEAKARAEGLESIINSNQSEWDKQWALDKLGDEGAISIFPSEYDAKVIDPLGSGYKQQVVEAPTDLYSLQKDIPEGRLLPNDFGPGWLPRWLESLGNWRENRRRDKVGTVSANVELPPNVVDNLYPTEPIQIDLPNVSVAPLDVTDFQPDVIDRRMPVAPIPPYDFGQSISTTSPPSVVGGADASGVVNIDPIYNPIRVTDFQPDVTDTRMSGASVPIADPFIGNPDAAIVPPPVRVEVPTDPIYTEVLNEAEIPSNLHDARFARYRSRIPTAVPTVQGPEEVTADYVKAGKGLIPRELVPPYDFGQSIITDSLASTPTVEGADASGVVNIDPVYDQIPKVSISDALSALPKGDHKSITIDADGTVTIVPKTDDDPPLESLLPKETELDRINRRKAMLEAEENFKKDPTMSDVVGEIVSPSLSPETTAAVDQVVATEGKNLDAWGNELPPGSPPISYLSPSMDEVVGETVYPTSDTPGYMNKEDVVGLTQEQIRFFDHHPEAYELYLKERWYLTKMGYFAKDHRKSDLVQPLESRPADFFGR